MRKIIYLQTLEHLDGPVISRIQALLKPDIALETFDFYGRFDFDIAMKDREAKFTQLNRLTFLRNDIYNTKFKSIKELAKLRPKITRYAKVLRQYQTQLLEYLNQKNPTWIFVASDHNMTLDLISKSKLMDKVVVIQPALITYRRPSIKSKIKNLFYRAVNGVYRMPIYELGYNWGDRKYKAKYLLWSHLESQNRYSRSSLCGDLFLEDIKEITFSVSNTLHTILIILPNLSIEKAEVRENYIRTLSQVSADLESTQFVLRWHPSDIPSNDFEGLENFCNFDQHLLRRDSKFDYVISSVSALAINVRRKTENVLIYHPGEYGYLGGHYINSEYFQICRNREDIVSTLTGELSKNLRDFSTLFRLDDASVAFLRDFCNLPDQGMTLDFIENIN